MRLSQTAIALLAFVVAAITATLVAGLAATVIEKRSTAAVSASLTQAGLDWVTVEADGLQVNLTGTAPNEAARFRALNLAGGEVESSRVRDGMDVTPTKVIEAPRFSLEILRNDREIQLIGLIPEGTDRAALSNRMQALAAGGSVTDMMETASFEAPAQWPAALTFGMGALDQLARSKISISADKVTVTAIAESEAEKRLLESAIAKLRPDGLPVEIDISAPRPVLTPFILRFVIDDAGARFDACSADTEAARDRIQTAATAVGMEGKGNCVIGLGVPTPRWGEASDLGIKALAEIGKGTITFSDADVTLEAATGTDQALFDKVVGELDAALPDVFSLQATLPQKAEAVQGPAEMTAELAKDTGKVVLRGRLTDETLRAAVESYSRAEFGTGNVLIATRPDPGLPEGWAIRVLAGLQALGVLDYGKLIVRPDTVEVTGVTGSMAARAKISQILSAQLGKGQTFKVDVRYDEALDPLAALPTPQECAAKVDDALDRQKIAFTPGSAEIDVSAGPLLDELATILKACPGLQMEIAGHTDSQGSEGGNKALSQARAEAVLLALQGRRVDVSGMEAVGYGESVPVADNATEEGREANRRIEFTLTALPVIPPGDHMGAAPASPAETNPAATAPAAIASGATVTPETTTPAATNNAPDFGADTSPSFAPKEKTRRPKSRPAQNG